MRIVVNLEAVQHARELVEGGRYRINSSWNQNKPTPNAVAAYVDAHGPDAAARWHLAFDLDAPDESPARWLYPVGDFTNVHDSALRAARSRAEIDGQPELAAAAEEVLEVFYRMNAC